jgi:hypothetical protein
MGDLVTFPKLKQLSPSGADLERETQVFEVSWFSRKFYRHEAEKLKKHGVHAMFSRSDESFFVMRKDIERLCEILGARVNGIVDGGSTQTRKVVIDLRSSQNAATAIVYLERKDEDAFLAGNPNTYFDVRAFGRKLSAYEVSKLRSHKITVSFSYVSDSYHIARRDMEAVLHILQAQLLAVIDTKTVKKVTVDVGALKSNRAVQ